MKKMPVPLELNTPYKAASSNRMPKSASPAKGSDLGDNGKIMGSVLLKL